MKAKCQATLCGLLLAWPAWALEVFASVPEWGALAREIGADKVQVFEATHGLQDPHHIDARPSLIARARRADLVIATGAELEIGWLPVVLRESGNARIQPGSSGYIEAADYVKLIEIPTKLDRSDGDVHAAGNPHFHLDPRRLIPIAHALAQRMAQLDAANAAHYRNRADAFAQRWLTRIAEWERRATKLKGARVWVHHRSFSYLFDWLGIDTAGTLEPKPGIEPDASHLASLVAQGRQAPPRMVIRTTYHGARAAEWAAAQLRVPAQALPQTVGGSDAARDLDSLFDTLVTSLLSAT